MLEGSQVDICDLDQPDLPDTAIRTDVCVRRLDPLKDVSYPTPVHPLPVFVDAAYSDRFDDERRPAVVRGPRREGVEEAADGVFTPEDDVPVQFALRPVSPRPRNERPCIKPLGAERKAGPARRRPVGGRQHAGAAGEGRNRFRQRIAEYLQL